MATATCPISDLDPFSAEFRADPFPRYAELRALGRVVWLEKHQIWCVPHYADIKTVLTDWRSYSNAGGGGLTNYFKVKPWRPPSLILDVDPPEHERTRKVLMSVFSAPAIKALKGGFEHVAEDLVRAAIAKGTVEAVEELIVPFPLRVFPDAVGMPELDRQTMIKYGGMVFGAFGPLTDWYHELMKDAAEVSAWIDARCERDALSPDGLGAQIYAAHDAGTISYGEAKLLVRSLLSAGVDTTIDSLGLALKCLAEFPDQFALLRDDPSLARNVFEEATRYDASSQSLFRTTACEVELAGQRIGAHEKVFLLLGSAGRDPAKWPEPDRFDIRRKIVGQMGYGWGIHGCVAQMMARLEGEVLFGAIGRLVSGIALAGEPEVRLHPGLRGLKSLPLAIAGR